MVTLFSDSKYVVDTVQKGWAKSWKARGWKKADNQPAINADLWDRALKVLEKHKVTIRWVKGHASNAGNNRCDELAVAATRSTTRSCTDRSTRSLEPALQIWHCP